MVLGLEFHRGKNLPERLQRSSGAKFCLRVRWPDQNQMMEIPSDEAESEKFSSGAYRRNSASEICHKFPGVAECFQFSRTPKKQTGGQKS